MDAPNETFAPRARTPARNQTGELEESRMNPIVMVAPTQANALISRKRVMGLSAGALIETTTRAAGNESES